MLIKDLKWLPRSMVECAELMREASEKRAVLDLKRQQKDRIDSHIQDYRYGHGLTIYHRIVITTGPIPHSG